MITLTIDGRPVSVPPGSTVLEAARVAGISIPTLCDRGSGKPALTSCMVCVVRVNGAARMVPSCATRVAEGMVVESETPPVQVARLAALELLLSDHVGPCVAPCQSVCPAHMHIDRMLSQIAEEDWSGAIATVKEQIPLPAILGRICPELCEKGCRRSKHDAPVSICRLKREVADRDLASPTPYRPTVAPPTGKRVAIIGAGPAGLSAAYYLAQAGHGCTVFDRHEQPGGSLLTRTTSDKLPRDVIAAEAEQIRRMGVHFVLGAQADAVQLLATHDAVLLATGDKAPVKTDRQSARTAVLNVFAAGAAAGSGKQAVQAVGDGHFAARAIIASLAGLTPLRRAPDWNCTGPAPTAEDLARKAGEVCCDAREEHPLDAAGAAALPADAAAEQWSHRQADRCLRCGCPKQDNCTLREVAAALGANPLAYRGDRRHAIPRLSATITGGRTLALDNGKCISCGKCVAIAEERGERYGLTWISRGFAVHLGPALGVDLAMALARSAEECAAACPTAALMLFSENEPTS
jgi:ferredoxin